MSARRRPAVATVGAVRVLAPKDPSPYFRLTWTEPDGRPGRTSGGRSLEAAKKKAAWIDSDLQRAAGAKGLVTLGHIAEEYLASPVGRHQKTGEDWTPSHHQQARRVLSRTLRGHEGRLAMELNRSLADVMRAQAGTRRTVKANTSVLRGFLRWGNTQGYFTPGQVEMLPERCAEVAPSLKGTAAPRRRRKERKVTESMEYIRDEDAPSAKQVRRLGKELSVSFPEWGRLAPELACASGPRWGELFQLTAHDIVLTGKKPMLRIHAQIDPGAKVSRGDDRRKLPKGEKTRETGIPVVTFTGYPLLKELKKRRKQALREQANGTNPEALLFPAKRGGMHHHTGFMNDYFAKAAIAAKWPHKKWVEECDRWNAKTQRHVRVTRNRTQFDLTWHSMRHRFARYAIDTLNLSPGELMAVGGWENETVVKNRYYNHGQEHTDSALNKF